MAGDWPDRSNKTPEQALTDLIRWQQRLHVKQSTGIYHYECFTAVDYETFQQNKTPARIAERLKKSPDFIEMAAALRSLPAEKRAQVFQEARRIARPTWRTMGYIDRSGDGQTEAGNAADLDIASALVDAFVAAVGK
jgi:hypothetical protein